MRIRIWKSRDTEVSESVLTWDEMGNEVSIEGTVCQAAQAIDMAGKIAVQQRDPGALLEVGQYFTKLADFIMSVSEYKRKNELDKKPGFQTGFQASKDEEEECTK